MLLSLFVAGVLVNLVVPWPVAAWLRRRWELESAFYGLIAMGAGAAIVAYVAAMGLWVAYQAIFPVPASVPRAELATRVDVLVFTTVALGVIMEGVKCYATEMFRTQLVRGNLPLFGVGVGLGAGMLQALLVLGATVWAAAAGQATVGAAEVALTFHHLGLLLLHCAVGALVMVRTAEGFKAQGILAGGALHGVTLLAATLVTNQGGAMALAGGPILLVGAAVAAGLVGWRVRSKGWPI